MTFPASGRVSIKTTTQRKPGQPTGSADPAGSTIPLRTALSSNPAPWPGIGSFGENQYVLSLQNTEMNFPYIVFFWEFQQNQEIFSWLTCLSKVYLRKRRQCVPGWKLLVG
jgi:hypothetical protein